MEYIEYAFPELEDIEKYPANWDKELIEELNIMNNYHKDMVRILLKKKVYEMLKKYEPQIDQVIVHPTSLVEDGGYQYKNAMVWVDDFSDPVLAESFGNEGVVNRQFQRALDESLKSLSPLLRGIEQLNVSELLNRYDNMPEFKEEPPVPPVETKKNNKYNL